MIHCDGPTCQGRTSEPVPNLAWMTLDTMDVHDHPRRLHFCGAGCLMRAMAGRTSYRLVSPWDRYREKVQ